MKQREDWDQVRNVVAIRLDALGDVLMTVPALRALKESGSGRRLTLLTSPAGARLATHIAEVDDVWIYESPWMKATAPLADSQGEFAMIEKLRQGGFDAAVIFTVYSQNPLPAAFLCQLADIPRRLAYCRENPYQLLTHWLPETEPQQQIRHEVRRQLDLVAAVGCRTGDERLSIRLPEKAVKWARGTLRRLELDRSERWVLLHPGASAASRRYPPESFALAARTLVLEHGCAVLVTGSEGERDLVRQVRREMEAPSHAVVGGLGVMQLAALIAEAPVVLTNNTGPAHLAAAVGTPVVDLYALTNPQHTPWMVPCRVLNHDVPCKYCYKSVCPEGHHDCLRQVSPAAVVLAVLELLDERQPAAGRMPLPLAMTL